MLPESTCSLDEVHKVSTDDLASPWSRGIRPSLFEGRQAPEDEDGIEETGIGSWAGEEAVGNVQTTKRQAALRTIRSLARGESQNKPSLPCGMRLLLELDWIKQFYL